MVAIVSRAAWGANPLTTPASSIATPTPDNWLHHTGSSGLHGASGMRSLQQGALSGGYVDLEYSYVVDTDGTIYESRGIGRNTAATGGSTNGVANNARSHAVCAMGNFEHDTVPQVLINALGDLAAWLFTQGATRNKGYTGPHRDAPGNATACCGRNLIARIGDINARASGSTGGGGGTTTPGGDDVPKDKDFVAAFANSEGAWRLQYDGGVQTIRGPFYGSYFTLPANVRNDPSRRFYALCAAVDGGKGYTLVSVKGETYTMNVRQ